jgi:hypothetical protein
MNLSAEDRRAQEVIWEPFGASHVYHPESGNHIPEIANGCGLSRGPIDGRPKFCILGRLVLKPWILCLIGINQPAIGSFMLGNSDAARRMKNPPAPRHITVTRAKRNYIDIVRPDQLLGASGLPSFRTCASSPHREPLTRFRRSLGPSLAILLLGTFGVPTLASSVPNAMSARMFRKNPQQRASALGCCQVQNNAEGCLKTTTCSI